MIINNWFKDGIIHKNNNKWTSSAEREIIINDEEPDLNEKLFISRTYSLNNSDTYGSPNNTSSTTMNSNNICQTMNSSGSSSCENSTQQHLTPKQFLEKYSLPRVIKIIPQEPIADSCGNFDPITLLSGQLLMFKHYNSGKVEARSFPNDRKDYSSLFVIPETYKGWFSVVTERGQIKARVYSSIQRLVSAQVTVFLTVSQDLPAYIQTNSGKDEISTQYTKTSVKSGQVLKLLAVYQDLNSNQSTKSKRLSWPLIGSKQHTSRYAQCLSSSNQVLFINFNTPGQFYAVSMTHNSTEENVTKVYQIQKLLRTFPLPVRVTIIGSNKNHGSMLLENYHKEHVVLSCVLDGADVTNNDTTSEKFRLLEIDVNSKFYVVKPGGRDIDERRLFYSPLVQRALKFCNDNSEQWISQLKVIHHIYPQNSNQILPNPQQNVSMEKSKKARKTSICDKITVKSASFRYSTSYGNEVARPVIRKQDLEKPNKPKVYDFNYKQTHDFLSLSSNVTRDSSSSQENSLQMRNSPMPDITPDRMYVRSNRSKQDSNSRSNQRPTGLPFGNGSTSSNDRTPYRYMNHRKDTTHDSIGSSDSANIRASPSKYLSNHSQESKNVKVSSLPVKDNTTQAVEAKRQTKHSFNQSKGQEERKVNSRNVPILLTQNSFSKTPSESNSKNEVSPVERLDRLTQSCNLLSFLNKQTNSYQNVPSNEQSKQKQYNQRVNNIEEDDTNDNKVSDEELASRNENITHVVENPVRKPDIQTNGHFFKQPNESLVQDRSKSENISLQSLQINSTPPKQYEGKHFYRVVRNENQPASMNGYRQPTTSSANKVKPPERNSFSYIHRQESQSNESKPVVSQANVSRSNSSRNSSPVETTFPRNQSFQQNFTPNQNISFINNSPQYLNQNVRNHVMKSPSSASTHSTSASMYSHSNSNHQNKLPLARKPIVKPVVVPPIKTHNKTPVPMPRLNVSYSKVHDAIDDHNDNTSASSENIYAEISDR